MHNIKVKKNILQNIRFSFIQTTSDKPDYCHTSKLKTITSCPSPRNLYEFFFSATLKYLTVAYTIEVTKENAL